MANKRTANKRKKKPTFSEITETLRRLFKEAVENGEIKEIVQADRNK